MDGDDQGTDDRILIQRFLDGEEAAFDRLVERYYQRLDRLAQHIVRNPSAAEDITQEAFLRAYRAMPRFRGEASVYSWLYRIIACRIPGAGGRNGALHDKLALASQDGQAPLPCRIIWSSDGWVGVVVERTRSSTQR